MNKKCFLWVLILLLFGLHGVAQNTGNENDPNFALVGWAAYEGGTTGGAEGEVDTVSSGAELQEAIDLGGPRIIYVLGTITSAPDAKINVKDVNDISIIGLDAGAEFDNVGIKIWKASNVIVRNLKIHHVTSGEKDCISIEGPADHIWIDHCELYNEYEGVDKDFYDGLLDVKRDAEYITISWNYMHDSWKTSLAGSSESDDYDRKITYHHNYFRNCNSRVPLFRGGNAHIFNCYFKDINETAINSRIEACVRIENNYFENVNNPWVSAFSDVLGGGDWSGNILVDSPFDYSSDDVNELPTCDGFTPYSYMEVLDSTENVPAIVMEYAGVGKISETDDEVPTDYTTHQKEEELSVLNYPNPTNGVTIFRIHLTKQSRAKLTLYNAMGKQVDVIADRVFHNGINEMEYDTGHLSAGLYLYYLQAGEETVNNFLIIQ